MTRMLDDLATAIQTEGLAGGATGWGLFKSFEAETPDAAVTLYETGGGPPGTADDYDLLTFQVRVRGAEAGYAAAHDKMMDVYRFLHAGEADVGSDYVYIYASQSGPLSLGYDTQRRPRLVMNYRVGRKRPAA